MRTYMTEQREVLLSFLREHLHEQLSIEEISAHLCVPGGISKSAIYRNIDRLVQEGSVQKFAQENGRRFLYRYAGHKDCGSHLHLKCTGCGQVFHMDDDATGAVLSAAMQNNFFQVDEKRSTLLGTCHLCREKK